MRIWRRTVAGKLAEEDVSRMAPRHVPQERSVRNEKEHDRDIEAIKV